MKSFKHHLIENDILRDWVMSDNRSKVQIFNNFDWLQRSYPYKAGGRLYRGLNFSSPKEYLQWRRATRDGYYTVTSIASWSPEMGEAHSYAMSPMVHQLDYGVALLYDAMKKNHERVMGFIGVIVVVDVPPNTGIDVNSSGAGLESEVILGPGKYKIVDVILEKKYKQLFKDIDINGEVMEILSKGGDIEFERWSALFHYKGADILPEAKRMIVAKAVDQMCKNFTVSVKKKELWRKFAYNNKEMDLVYPDGVYRIEMWASSGLEAFLSDADFNANITPDEIERFRSTVIKKIDAATKVLVGQTCGVEFGNSYYIKQWSHRYHINFNETKHIGKIIGSTYHRINEIMRRLNREPDIAEMGHLVEILKDYATDNWGIF